MGASDSDVDWSAWLDSRPDKSRHGTEAYCLNGFRLAKIREQLGGVRAVDSSMFKRSIYGLLRLGWTAEQIISAADSDS